jgi:mRNA-degrading endonuclease RelE of RelBE toxin-antitoxin system
MGKSIGFLPTAIYGLKKLGGQNMKRFKTLREAKKYLANYPYVDKSSLHIYKYKTKVYRYAVCTEIEWLNH